MRLISWNVARRIARLAEQATALAERDPDVVALQEITVRTQGAWLRALADSGLPHALASLDFADPAREPAGPRRTGVLVAAKVPLAALGEQPAVPWPESVLAADAGAIELYVAHVPNARNGWIKPQTLHALHDALARSAAPRILCGDLNTPRKEKTDGEVWTFAQDAYGRLREERGEEWDAAERDIVCGLGALGMVDAFRSLNGYEPRDLSWTYMRWRRSGYRLDHVFASGALEPRAARYHHDWRTSGLSDHSAIEADFGVALAGA